MKYIMTLLLLAASQLHAYQDWLSGNDKFDFQYCEEVFSKNILTYNGNPFTKEETISIRLKVDKCITSSSKSYIQKAMQLGTQEKIPASGIKGGISIVSETDLQIIYDELRQNPYFPYEIIETQSCFDRAKFITIYLLMRGIRSGQILASDGDFEVPSVVYPDKIVHWDNHTAIFLYNSKGQRIIIDPSLSKSPLPTDQWINTLIKNSNKKNFKLSFGESYFLQILESKNKKIDKIGPLERLAGVMMADTYHLLNRSRPTPARIATELIPSLIEHVRFHSRRTPSLTGQPTK